MLRSRSRLGLLQSRCGWFKQAKTARDDNDVLPKFRNSRRIVIVRPTSFIRYGLIITASPSVLANTGSSVLPQENKIGRSWLLRRWD
jgi:hypothetical protein